MLGFSWRVKKPILFHLGLNKRQRLNTNDGILNLFCYFFSECFCLFSIKITGYFGIFKNFDSQTRKRSKQAVILVFGR